MRSSAVLSIALAALTNALGCASQSCTLNEIPASVTCGATGFIGASDTPYVKKSQAEGTIEACLASCIGGCKAISFDTQYKTCYLYIAPVSKMKLYQVSSPMTFHYFDRACTFEAREKKCGPTGFVGASNTPYYKKSQAEGTIENCLAACRGGCKAVGFDVQYKTCYFYVHPVANMKLYTVKSPMSFYYFDRACGFENTAGTVCGQTASAESSGAEPYTSAAVPTKAECLAACDADAECKGVRYTNSSKTCAQYKVAVKDTGAVLGTTPAVNAFYDVSCYECTAPVVPV
ncbi:hypothetical protein B0T11DRAFT_342030 [Plectosphaerella cucumerina]|uniref:Apple domain-containing protein n=1 Tax=Plectosphaerella cucumerina TaxID=40658 RepID=A0A8K0WZU5_9PEZI|nr:hypothetical protein B0T11DRAFT_342030 [Plectosphaerella cucumerina]